MNLSNAVIRFEPDGYDVRQPWMMGRQVAGDGFLRAAIEARGDAPLDCYTPLAASAQTFSRMVADVDPSAQTRWIKPGEMARSNDAPRTLYLPDPSLALFSRRRLREGVASYSLCGVTHTTATPRIMSAIAELLSAPVAPWDALICTSTAVAETVRRIHEAEADYIRWRFGAGAMLTTPQLPVIPLGVHPAEFEFDEAERAETRRDLGLAEDEIVALFVGRLVFSGKAHPFQMFHGLQEAARRSGKRIALVLCGWAPTTEIAQAYISGAQLFAPDVRLINLDGREPVSRRRAWAVGEIFVSLSDGIQETFGLTPLEAMAAGIPCVVSDWNGYRETVRHGEDGFRVATWSLEPGSVGVEIASLQEADRMTYNESCWATSACTSVDMSELVARLTDLIEHPDLRRRMGDAGRTRARALFDWRYIFGQYQALWTELDARRRAAAGDPASVNSAPRSASSGLDPFHAFGHYPTKQITPETMVSLVPGAGLAAFRDRRAHTLFIHTKANEALAAPMLQRLGQGGASVAELGRAAGLGPSAAGLIIGTLAKMALVRLESGRHHPDVT